MLEIITNYSLHKQNTFGIRINAQFYCGISSIGDLNTLKSDRRFAAVPKLILGGGSNILFTKDFEGLVIHPEFRGIEITGENDHDILVRAGSGVEWDVLVSWAVDNNYGGIENLSAIPGSVGAAPIQNIGAYGSEVSEVIEKVEGYDLNTDKQISFTLEECNFSYRDSIFKKKYRNRFLVTYVSFRLHKEPHKLITNYGPVEEELRKYPRKDLRTMREIISRIREAKLPDHKVNGNAGSFFKNPVVNEELANDLKRSFADLPVFHADKGVKLSAAWLIDHSGLKDFRMGNAATHKDQPLVLINLGEANGSEILELADYIRQTVWTRFGVNLEPEVNIL